MNRLVAHLWILLLAALIPCISRSQGLVDFNNNRNFVTVADRLVYNVTGEPLVGTNLVAQLYYGADVTSLQVATAAPARFRVPTTVSPGTWSGGNRTISGFGMGATLTVVIRAWDQSNSNSWETSSLKGESAPFAYLIPPAGGPPNAFYIENFRGFSLSPCFGSIRMTPTNGSMFLSPASFVLEAENLNASGTITNVIYRSGLDVLGSASVSPFRLALTNLPWRDYAFVAEAQTDSGESCRSETSFVRVMGPPNPSINPSPCIALRGRTAVLTASPGGSTPVAYDWYFNQTRITTNSGPTLFLSGVESNAGFYSVVASNFAGMGTSAPVTLTLHSVVMFVDGYEVHQPAYTSAAPALLEFKSSYLTPKIVYTLDGRKPHLSSLQYTGRFELNRSAVIRAVAYNANNLTEFEEAVPLEFIRLPTRKLMITSTGGGTVWVQPNKSAYLVGEPAQVTALPQPGWRFLRWSGDVTDTNVTVTVQMTTDRCLTAVFGTSIFMTNVTGQGMVVLDPPGGIYPFGTTVQVYGVPGPGHYGYSIPWSYTIFNTNPVISYPFFPLASNEVTLTTLIDGGGYVDLIPRYNRYTNGQTVQVRAVPMAPDTFVEWSGDVTGSETTKLILLETNKMITAHFSKTPSFVVGPCAQGIDDQRFFGTFKGAWGTAYTVEHSDAPGAWNHLLTITNSYGSSQFMDWGRSNSAHRIYRVRRE
jgi:hypothetical protein